MSQLTTKQKKHLIDLQHKVFNEVIQGNKVVTVYLISGLAIKCKIKGFDDYTLLLDVNGKQQTIYKSAISTVSY